MVVDFLMSVFLAYGITAFEKVHLDDLAHPVDRPIYIGQSKKWWVLHGMAWPFDSWMNRELGWYVIVFIASVAFFFAGYQLLRLVFDGASPWTPVILVAVVTIPGISTVANGLRGMMVGLLWGIASRMLGLRLPAALAPRRHYDESQD